MENQDSGSNVEKLPRAVRGPAPAVRKRDIIHSVRMLIQRSVQQQSQARQVRQEADNEDHELTRQQERLQEVLRKLEQAKSQEQMLPLLKDAIDASVGIRSNARLTLHRASGTNKQQAS